VQLFASHQPPDRRHSGSAQLPWTTQLQRLSDFFAQSKAGADVSPHNLPYHVRATTLRSAIWSKAITVTCLWLHADSRPLPSGCNAQTVSLAALHFLRSLPQPMLPKTAAVALSTAAREIQARPGIPYVARYIARNSLSEWRAQSRQAHSAAAPHHDVWRLLQGIVKTLHAFTAANQVRASLLCPECTVHTAMPSPAFTNIVGLCRRTSSTFVLQSAVALSLPSGTTSLYRRTA
jgi:hypothetical protein